MKLLYKNIRSYALLTFLLFPANNAISANYTYEKYKKEQHVVHILIIDPKYYVAEIVKADDVNKTLPSIAKNSNSDIAINGGFFMIDKKFKIKPSGTLVIKGKNHNVKQYEQALLISESGKLHIKLSKATNHINDNISIVSGIPMLIKDGKINEEIYEKNTPFYSNRNARTAIGIDKNKKIVIIVVEHHYFENINIDDIKILLNEKNTSHKNLAIKNLEYKPVQGLTILELAELMKKYNCVDAINLDGGTSSGLWINGKLIKIQEEIPLKSISDIISFRKK